MSYDQLHTRSGPSSTGGASAGRSGQVSRRCGKPHGLTRIRLLMHPGDPCPPGKRAALHLLPSCMVLPRLASSSTQACTCACNSIYREHKSIHISYHVLPRWSGMRRAVAPRTRRPTSSRRIAPRLRHRAPSTAASTTSRRSWKVSMQTGGFKTCIWVEDTHANSLPAPLHCILV